MQRNHDLVIKARNHLCRELKVEPPAPDSMLGSLSTIFFRRTTRSAPGA
jgi:isopenicillin-N epimerase